MKTYRVHVAVQLSNIVEVEYDLDDPDAPVKVFLSGETVIQPACAVVDVGAVGLNMVIAKDATLHAVHAIIRNQLERLEKEVGPSSSIAPSGTGTASA